MQRDSSPAAQAASAGRHAERTQRGTAKAAGALDGIRVIDLSRVLAGPLCTQMLADHGAQVIKVEPPFGDETRKLGPPFAASGDAAYYTALNRGKQAISLDLSEAGDRDQLHGLLGEADVVIENFLPGTMQKWQLDYERDLAPRHPRLIHCSITGFGADGPLGGLPGYDAVLQAICGLMSVNGTAQSGPTRVGVPIVDHLTGYAALSGILLALVARGRTGRGQALEISLYDTALSLLVPHAANWMVSGVAPGLTGNAHPNIAPYDCFDAADGPVFLGIVNDGQFGRFCRCVGRPALAEDPRYASNAARLRHAAELRAEIQQLLATHSREPLCQALMAAGVAAGPVNTVAQALEHAHTLHRGMRVRREQDGYQGLGIPIRLAATPGHPGRSPPAFDQDREQWLGSGAQRHRRGG